MATQTHLARRGRTYYWRRALPRALAEKTGRRELRLSLRTHMVDGARYRARRLSAIADILFPVAMDAMASQTSLPSETVARLMADILRHELDAADGFRAAEPPRAPDEAEWASRFSLLARKGWLDALATNNHDQIAYIVADGLERHGLEVDPDSAAFARLCRRALRVMARAETVNALRELGVYLEDDADVDLTPAWQPGSAEADLPAAATPPAAPRADTAPAAAVGGATPEPQPETDPRTAAEPSAEPEPTGPIDSPDHGRPFSVVWAEFLKIKLKGDWKPGTGKDAQRSADLFTSIIGDKPLDEITQADARRFRLVLDEMPDLHGRSIFKGLKPSAAIKRLQEENARVFAAVNADLLGGEIDEETAAARIAEKSFTTMAPKTVNKHLDLVGQLFKWGETRQFWPVRNYFGGQRYSRRTLDATEKPRLALEPEEMKALFETPLFTGSHHHFRHRPGDKPHKDAFYWAPLIMAHQGMRLEEACQLHIVDIEQIDGVWCILVQKGVERNLKTRSAARVLPIHSNLIRLGLIDRWREFKARGEKRLFPELKRDKHHQRLGTAITKKWTEYRKNLGIYQLRKDGHSLRHSFDTLLINADVPTVRVAELLGHKREGETEGRYYKGATLARLQEAVEKLQFGLNFVEIDGEWRIACSATTEILAAA
ncbi:site-specific integrase [Inquilinus sp. CAU 1745]|uniref:site-specific integrase n=1 Tax=Inquilinus sp. CAU 1745 TaxID=3140369 RepID=UPI00325B4761